MDNRLFDLLIKSLGEATDLIKDPEIDCSDIPELDDNFWVEAKINKDE